MKLEIWTEHGPQNSKPIFDAFIKSLENAGETIVLNRSVNADVAVIWSVLWRGRMERYKHIWDDYRKLGKPVIVIEVGGLRRNESFKIGINGINRKADFANQEFDDKRWPLFKHNFKPWNPTGDIIVICGQHDASEQWKGLPRMGQWIQQQIKEIRQYTTRPILVRPHPRNNIDFQESDFDNVKVRHPKRDFIIEKLRENDIHVNISYPWPIHLMEGYSSLDYKEGDLPITEKISQEIFSLPMYPTLSEDEQTKVVNVLKTIDSNYL